MQLGKKLWILAALVLVLLAALLSRPAAAAGEDVAMFYDDLAPYGNWMDYGDYGPVWSPSRVTSNWRPYLDGRWMPTEEGWTFETSEPWGWATYHFGNWMPTSDYGWVWVPGSTWYPSTAAWRTSDDYVGWAPIPPPNYVPEPAYYPAAGYVPGAPLVDLLTAPFWIFARAASFLLGFGQPYLPSYSYYNCGCLSPFNYSRVAFRSTFFLNDFYSPFYAPYAYYSFGPPFPFVSRVANINIVNINNFVRKSHFRGFHNVLPPDRVFRRKAFFRDAIPKQVQEGRRFEVRRAQDIRRAERELNHPRAVRPPAGVPRFDRQVPRIRASEQERRGRVGLDGRRGTRLPGQAIGDENRQMRRQVRQERRLRPESGQRRRMETRPEFRPPPREFRAAPSREFRAPRRESRSGAISQRQFRSPRMPREFRAAPRSEFRAPSRSAPRPRQEMRGAPSRSAPARSQPRSGARRGGRN